MARQARKGRQWDLTSCENLCSAKCKSTAPVRSDQSVACMNVISLLLCERYKSYANGSRGRFVIIASGKIEPDASKYVSVKCSIGLLIGSSYGSTVFSLDLNNSRNKQQGGLGATF